MQCFNCGDFIHIQRFCPQRRSNTQLMDKCNLHPERSHTNQTCRAQNNQPTFTRSRNMILNFQINRQQRFPVFNNAPGFCRYHNTPPHSEFECRGLQAIKKRSGPTSRSTGDPGVLQVTPASYAKQIPIISSGTSLIERFPC